MLRCGRCERPFSGVGGRARDGNDGAPVRVSSQQLAELLCSLFMRVFLVFSRITVSLALKLKQEIHWCLLVTFSCFTSITSEKLTDRCGNKTFSVRLPRWEPVTPTTKAPTNKLGDNSAIKRLNGAAAGGNQRRKSSVWDLKTTPPLPNGPSCVSTRRC